MEALLMGGQACLLYGAAEFSRDADFAVLASLENLSRLQDALDELQAEAIAVPPFDVEYLDRGHAIHFRFPDESRQIATQREALREAFEGDLDAVREALAAEEARERELDRAYRVR